MTQSRSQFHFWAEKSEFNSFEAKLLTPSLPKEKRGTVELFPIICQSAPYLVEKVTLGWFTPNPVFNGIVLDCTHNIMVTCPSGDGPLAKRWGLSLTLQTPLLSKHHAVSLHPSGPSWAARETTDMSCWWNRNTATTGQFTPNHVHFHMYLPWPCLSNLINYIWVLDVVHIFSFTWQEVLKRCNWLLFTNLDWWMVSSGCSSYNQVTAIVSIGIDLKGTQLKFQLKNKCWE